MTRNVSPTFEAIIIDSKKTHPSLDHATLFNALKVMLKDEIKQAMEAPSTALQNTFAKVIKEMMSPKMKILSNLMAVAMNQTLDQIRKDNARLTTYITDITRKVRSTAAAKTTST